MAQFFLRSKREEGEAPLYTKIRRNGMQMYVCTGIKVDIREWNKAQRSFSAMQRYEQTEEGAKVHDLQMRVMKAVDTLYAEGKINTKEDKAIIEEAMNNIVTGGTEEIQQVKKIAEAKSRKYVVQFYEYFFAGISDGSISHGSNSEYSAGSVQVWKTFGRYLHEYCGGNVKKFAPMMLPRERALCPLMILTSHLPTGLRSSFRRRILCRTQSTRMLLASESSVTLLLWRATTRMLFPLRCGRIER